MGQPVTTQYHINSMYSTIYGTEISQYYRQLLKSPLSQASGGVWRACEKMYMPLCVSSLDAVVL